jgi:thiamine-phosphate pyrophosphorylase
VTRALPAPPLLVMTDRTATADLMATAAAALRGGCRWIMLREKDLDTVALAEIASRLKVAGHPCRARITINGDLDAVLVAGADGVHLPQGHSVIDARRALGPDALIGTSAHSLDEAVAAERAGADYVTISPVFESAGKPGYGPLLGPGGVSEVAQSVAIPVLALAGVTPDNAAACLAAGAAGIAVMGGVMAADDPERAVRDLVSVLGA